MIKKPHRKPAEDPSTIGGGLKARGRERRESLSIAIASAPRRSARNDLLPAMELVSIPLKDLRFPKNTVRKLTEGHIREVANSISAMGFSVPVLIGKGNEIISGATSVKAAESLGLPSVPCVRVDHLSDEEQAGAADRDQPGRREGRVGPRPVEDRVWRA